jgi:hypothetical protein
MKNHILENTTEIKTTLSPYQAERAEAQAVPVSLPARAGDALLRLQRRAGNRAVQRLLVQRQEPEEEEEIQLKRLVQRRGGGEGASASLSTGFALDDETTGRINRARGGGRSLDTTLQEQIGAALGHDFANVRVHTSPESDALNRQLSARAFTSGRDIFLRQGDYNPHSSGGRELIAHELSHVVQQATGRVRGSGGRMTVRPAGDAFEQEADAQARRAASAGYEAGAQRTDDREGGEWRKTLGQESGIVQTKMDTEIVQRTVMEHVDAAPEDLNEKCHDFVYRWLVKDRKITGNYPPPPLEEQRVLAYFGIGPNDQAARADGHITVQAGDIVAFWEEKKKTSLEHTMIAEAPTEWVGANNVGCFGAAPGRQRIPQAWVMAEAQGPEPFPGEFGWAGAGNRWYTPTGGKLLVTRRPARPLRL